MKNSDAGFTSGQRFAKVCRFKKMKKRVLGEPPFKHTGCFYKYKNLYRLKKPFMSSPFATPQNYILVRW